MAEENKVADKEEKKNPSPLEEIVTTGKNLGALAAGIATPFIFSGENRTNAMITAYPLAAGSYLEDKMENKSLNSVKAAKESLVGTLMTPAFASVFKYLEVGRQYATSYAGSILGGAATVTGLAAAQAMFVGMYQSMNHVIQNWSFKGLYKKLKNDYWPTVKNTWKRVLPFSAFNPLFLYPYGIAVQLGYASLMTFMLRVFGLKKEGATFKNLIKNMNPVPYVKGAIKNTGKFGINLVKELFNGVSYLGSSVQDMYKKPPPGPATQTA